MSDSQVVIAIDIGNTRFKAGRIVFADGEPRSTDVTYWEHGEEIPWRVIREWLGIPLEGDDVPSSVRVGMATTHPTALQRLLDQWHSHDLPNPVLIDDFRKLPLVVDVEFPEKVGIDRLLNAVAAHRLVEQRCPVIVVDCGSATTVNYVGADGTFHGGAILPGFALTAKALHQYTAQLPLVAFDRDALPDPIGRNTTSAIRSGLYWGQIGAIRELISRMTEQANPSRTSSSVRPSLILTGGGSESLVRVFPEAVRYPDLTLQGLAMVAREME